MRQPNILPEGITWPKRFQPGNIDGVVLNDLCWHNAQDGGLVEVCRIDGDYWGNSIRDFGQLTRSRTLPGSIKAFHLHQFQDDAWHLISGQIQVGLLDFRPESQSFGARQTVYLAGIKPQLLVIPHGVAHGFRTLGSETAELIYVVSDAYCAEDPDEWPIAWDHPRIGYDWSIKNG